MWNGGVAKIAYHSLIGDFKQGGIKYKDIDATVKSLSLKFIQRLLSNQATNSTCLPRYWLMDLFKIPTEGKNSEERYFKEYFETSLNILDCKLAIPKRSQWKA